VNDPKDSLDLGFQPSYRVEARIFAKYILKTKPNAKVAISMPMTISGKDYVNGIKISWGRRIQLIIAEEGYETTEPSDRIPTSSS